MPSQCALCLQPRKLCNSHIIPEFLYLALYDAKHRLHLLSAHEDGSKIRQKGFKEFLLCEECECKIASWERYAKAVLKGGTTITYRQDGELIFISGLDYLKFRLFQLSMLWRAGVSSLPFFSKVQLGPHAEVLRRLIFNEDPGNHLLYPCAMIGLAMDSSSMDAVVQPTELRLDGERAYRFVCGGFIWGYVVSKRPAVPPLADAVLNPSGTLVFQIKNALEFEDMMNLFRERKRKGLSPPNW